jgi:lactate permease
LIGLAIDPLQAVVLPSIGCSWAVTFGSLGSSFQALIAASGVPGELLAPPTAIFLGAAALVAGPMLGFVQGGWKETRRMLAPALLIGGVMAAVMYLTAASGLWNLASFAAGGAGLLVSLPLARLWRHHPHNPALQPVPQAGPGPDGNSVAARRRLALSLAGYGILIAVTLVVQLVTPVREFLSLVVIQVVFPQVETGLGYVTPAGIGRKIALFSHAGASLVYAAGLAYLLFRRAGLYQPGALRRILDRTARQLIVTTFGIVVMITMAVVMELSGMTDRLARLLADGVGQAFPLVSPWIGALGAFMTGSNTNSNVVFAGLQMRTAGLLALNPRWILAAQTAGAALGSVIAPAKVIVGGSTAGLAGREGEILRRLVGYIVLLILLVSLLAILAVYLAG